MKTIKEMIEVMQAYEDGKDIEVISINGATWLFTATPDWNWRNIDYRIKPTPRVFYAPEYENGVIGRPHRTEKAAINHNSQLKKIIKLQEIIE